MLPENEILIDRQNSLTFEPGNATELAKKIVIALDNPGCRFDYAQAGKKTILENFTLDRMVTEFETWLTQIIENRRMS